MKVAVVTGASAGIGAAAVRKLAALGWEVAVVGRSPAKTAAVAGEIGAEPFTVDYGSLDSVRELAARLLARYPRIDVLANNAGGQSLRRVITADGHEMTFQVNYLAPFLLTGLLLERLRESPDARVISTSSAGHKVGRIDLRDLNGTGTKYWAMKAYANWKLGNVLFTRELARRSAGTSVTASMFHPGPADSDFFRDGGLLGRILASPVGKLVKITPERGAEPLVHLATVADPQSVNGAYFDRMKQREPKGPQATDDDLARRLWDRTEDLLGRAGGQPGRRASGG